MIKSFTSILYDFQKLKWLSVQTTTELKKTELQCQPNLYNNLFIQMTNPKKLTMLRTACFQTITFIKVLQCSQTNLTYNECM